MGSNPSRRATRRKKNQPSTTNTTDTGCRILEPSRDLIGNRVKRIAPIVLLLATSAIVPSCQAPPVPEAVPTPPPSFSDLTPEAFGASELITRSYTWSYWPCRDHEWTWEIQVPQALYDHYRAKPRPPTNDYSVYVTDPRDTAYTGELARKLQEEAQKRGFDENDTIHFAASFVQKLPYALDIETTGYDEYPRYPIETLVDEGSDCEDTSILLAKLLHTMGYDVVLVNLTSHIAVGVLEGQGFCGTYYRHNGKRYFYLETTGEAGRAGVVPSEYRTQPAYIYDIVPAAIVTHGWEATIEEKGYRLITVVENLGTAVAHDIHVLAGFYAAEGRILNSTTSESFDLKAGQSATVTVHLRSPTGIRTRLMVYVVTDGRSADSSHSEWFKT